MKSHEILDELGRLEAKIDELHDYVYGGQEDKVPFALRIIELERFQRKTEDVLYGHDPTKDDGLVDRVKNRRVVAIAFVVCSLFSAFTALDMFFGDAVRRHFREINQKAPNVTVPEEKGKPWQ